jgi:hypothetical protein
LELAPVVMIAFAESHPVTVPSVIVLLAIPLELVTVDPTGKVAPPPVIVQVTVAPGTGLLFESVTSATKEVGRVVPTIPVWELPLLIAICEGGPMVGAPAVAVSVKVLDVVVP